jgi:hypothetical protein
MIKQATDLQDAQDLTPRTFPSFSRPRDVDEE